MKNVEDFYENKEHFRKRDGWMDLTLLECHNAFETVPYKRFMIKLNIQPGIEGGLHGMVAT